MKQNEKISIIVPVYNGEKFLKNCITSIIENDYKNIEVLLINDGSTDGSLEICKEFSDNDNRIKVYNQENSGIAKTRNFGLKVATGTYICFADQDDVIPQNAYISLINNLKKYDSEMCIGSIAQLINNEEKIYRKYEKSTCIKEDEIKKYLLKISTRCFANEYCKITEMYTWTIWNCIYKKSIIDEYDIEFKRFVDYEDDFIFNFDFIKRCKKISFEENIVYYWRKNIQSESNIIKYIENLYNKKKQLNEYIIEELKKIEDFDIEKWIELSNQKFFIDEIINTANPQNLENDEKNIEYLTNIYVNELSKIKHKLNYNKNLKEKVKNIDIYIAWKFMNKNDCIKAYKYEKRLFFKFFLKLKVNLKKMLYKGEKN